MILREVAVITMFAHSGCIIKANVSTDHAFIYLFLLIYCVNPSVFSSEYRLEFYRDDILPTMSTSLHIKIFPLL